MTFWIRTEKGETIKLHDSTWRNRIYAHGDAADDPDFLLSRVRGNPASNFISSVKFAYKKADLLREGVQKVLEIELSQADKTKQVAEALESVFQNPLTFKLYNVDVLPEQAYFYEKNSFPIGLVDVETGGDQITKWDIQDNVESVDYEIPDLKVLALDIAISSKVPRFDSRLLGITLQGSSGSIKFEERNEIEIIEKARNEITRADPDILVTRNGDLFALPFLYLKAQKLNVDFNLNRDPEMKPSHLASIRAGGTTFFSYGRILFKAKMQKLYGRVHLDEANTFVFDQCRFEGLFEITRLCRMPLHNAVRASIGKCLSSIQFHYASKKDILIPWKPWMAEDPKTFRELLIQDRGGLVLEPLPGIHEHVGEIDFASLYPSIICKYNISAETLNCSCCKEKGNRIEGLDLHICTQPGIVAESLRLPLEKRLEYRDLRDTSNDKHQKQVYNERAGALKWILVCCFGYLSYRNATFGKIDSHIAVCGYARKTLLQAMRVAEKENFRVLHGIVDSLWLSKPGTTREDYQELCDKIRSETKFKIVLEGIYKWIVFLPSKTDSKNQVANRYFGCFEDTNEMKVRGVEYRRGDTPVYFKLFQKRIFEALSKCDDAGELRKTATTECVQIFHEFANRLERHDVSPIELLITRRLSKNLEEYRSKRQLSVSATSKLAEQGLKLQAGQAVSYVISNYRTAGTNRAVPEELAETTRYDSGRYVELLADCCSPVLSPFGVTQENLLTSSKPRF